MLKKLIENKDHPAPDPSMIRTKRRKETKAIRNHAKNLKTTNKAKIKFQIAK